MLVTLKEPDCG